MPVVVPVVIAPVNDNSMIQDVVILNQAVPIAVGDVQNKVDSAQFSGDNGIL